MTAAVSVSGCPLGAVSLGAARMLLLAPDGSARGPHLFPR